MFSFQSNEVGGSYHLEKEGLRRLMEFLKGEGLQIGVTDTNRSTSGSERIIRKSSITTISGM